MFLPGAETDSKMVLWKPLFTSEKLHLLDCRMTIKVLPGKNNPIYTPGGSDLSIYHFCNWPCWDQTTDTTSCKDDGLGNNGCHGCQQRFRPTCGLYREYKGQEIKTCYDGCPQFDWNIQEKDCYILKYCHAQMHEMSWCHECNGEMIYDPILQVDDNCGSIGACLIIIACDLVETCFQCEKGDEVADTITVETCNCN